MPWTAADAPWTVVMHGMFIDDRRAADLVAVHAGTRVAVRGVDHHVDLACLDQLDDGALTLRQLLAGLLVHLLAGDAVPAQHRPRCPRWPGSRKPRSASRLTGKISDRLSLLATETNTDRDVGSEPYAAVWLFANAVPKSASMPITSPVDFISGLSRVSTPVPSARGSG